MARDAILSEERLRIGCLDSSGCHGCICRARSHLRLGDRLIEVVQPYQLGLPWMQADIDWQTATPESHGMDSSKLDRLMEDLASRDTNAFLVIRNNHVVYEWYAGALGGPNRKYHSAAAAKALVGSMTLLVALSDGRLRTDDFASKYIPAWENDPTRSRITIRHLAAHSSGIENVSFDENNEEQLRTGWRRTYLENDKERFHLALTRAPVNFLPGSQTAYSGVGFYALAYALAAALRNAPQSDIHALLKERIMDPIGIPDSHWQISYGKTYNVDGMKLYAIGSGAEYTARAVARIGQLMLNEGDWKGKPLVPAARAREMVARNDTPIPDRASGEHVPASSLGWWLNFDGIFPALPRDAFLAAGGKHQVLLVIPSLDLVTVRFGGALAGTHWGDGFWDELETYFLNPFMATITQRRR